MAATASAAPMSATTSTIPAESPALRKRARKAINCEPCRTHKLKCNRARPCSGCVLRGTQHLCYPDEPEPHPKQSNIPDPVYELNQMQRSLAALQGHYRSISKFRRTGSPSPDPATLQEMLLETPESDGSYVGPTFAATPLLNYIQSDGDENEPDEVGVEGPARAQGVVSVDLLSELPAKPTLQALVEMYLTSGRWNYMYLDEDILQRKLDAYVMRGEIDDATLALFFAVISVALYYCPWPHNILHAFPEPAMATGDRFHKLCMTMIERMHESITQHPTLEHVELHLLVGHYLSSSKLGDSAEELWSLTNRLNGLTTALGLHRDPERWNLPSDVILRRRWAWWNTLSFERYTCMLIGRPPLTSDSHFDTQYPISDMYPSDQKLADNPMLHYLTVFRFALALGPILDDLHHVRPMDADRVAMHDRSLIEWQDTWPPDIKLDEFGIAAAMSKSADVGMTRRGVQCMFVTGMLHFVRFRLNRPQTTSSKSNSIAAQEKVAGAAAKLISLHVRAVPDYISNSVLTVPGHLGHAPYNMFIACMFYTYQLLSDPDQPGANHFRSNLSEAISVYGKVREMPIADRCFKALIACHPPPESDDPDAAHDSALMRRERIAIMRRITFPYIGLADVSDLENVYPVEGESKPTSPAMAKAEQPQASTSAHNMQQQQQQQRPMVANDYPPMVPTMISAGMGMSGNKYSHSARGQSASRSRTSSFGSNLSTVAHSYIQDSVPPQMEESPRGTPSRGYQPPYF